MRIEAAGRHVTAPLFVGNLLVVHIRPDDAGKGRDDLLQRDGRPDQTMEAAGSGLRPGEKAHGDARDILGRNERQHGALVAPGQPDRAFRRQL